MQTASLALEWHVDTQMKFFVPNICGHCAFYHILNLKLESTVHSQTLEWHVGRQIDFFSQMFAFVVFFLKSYFNLKLKNTYIYNILQRYFLILKNCIYQIHVNDFNNHYWHVSRHDSLELACPPMWRMGGVVDDDTHLMRIWDWIVLFKKFNLI